MAKFNKKIQQQLLSINAEAKCRHKHNEEHVDKRGIKRFHELNNCNFITTQIRYVNPDKYNMLLLPTPTCNASST
jgi:hypothetical protein